LVQPIAGKQRMMIFPADLKNKTMDRIENKVDEFDKSNSGIKAEVTGNQYLLRDLNEMMISNQANTLMIAFIFIFLLLLISLREIKISLISLLPIGITVAILYGFMGWSGISLNIATTTIFSITLGVGIDYAVHYSSVWKKFRNRGMTAEEAVEKAYTYTVRPILANAFGLAVGLSALLLSPLRIHFYVSTLMWVSMMLGVFLSLSFLPTILKKIK
jgi:hypothetical protein